MTICAFTSICEEDARWTDQYLAEAARLEMPFAIHFDRCSLEMRKKFYNSPLCVGSTAQNDPAIEFTEMHKQAPFNVVEKRGFKWAMAWDCDETYEKDAPRKLAEIDGMDIDYIDTPWVNLWGDEKHVRVDGPFGSGHRVKFYNLDRQRWAFTHPITNGPKMVDAQGIPFGKHIQQERVHRYPLVCLHWGLMTRELREEHKARWDRIYTTAVGANPYGIWRYACDEVTYPPTIKEHNYL